MLAKSFILLATLASAAIAAPAPQKGPAPPAPGGPPAPPGGQPKPPCGGPTPTSPSAPTSTKGNVAVTPTLPAIGGGATELPTPASGSKLLAIAVGHGIQNYTCTAASGTPSAVGAIAVLYDVEALYPGTPGSGLSQAQFDGLSKTVLYGQDLPINLVNPAAARPGTPDKPNALPETEYATVVNNSFIAQADLNIPGVRAPFLGHHYFDVSGAPTFDLTAKGILATVAKKDSASAPSTADKGLIGTGAVAWLRLVNNPLKPNSGNTTVYRVVTAGGNGQDCSVSGVGSGSVPYTAQYWFFQEAAV